MSKKVYIGVGHGGSDSGAVANGLYEKNVNLDISNACASFLKKYVDVKISRTTDIDSTINSKVSAANSWGADIVVEIHNNAGGGDGAEVYYSRVGGTSKTLAQNILDSIVALGQQSRGIKTKLNSSGKDYFGMIRDTNAPAVLVECAFLDSKDKEIVDTAAERKAMGEAIAKGILKTLNISFTASAETKTTTSTENTNKYSKGDSIQLSKRLLYASSTSTKAVNTITGTYFIYDGKSYNGRYRITTRKEYCGKTPAGKYVTGYVKL